MLKTYKGRNEKLSNELNNYGGLIWTNHALQRLSERELNKVMLGLFGIDQIKVGTPKLKELGFITNLACLDWQGGEYTRIEVVAKQNINKKWIILSVWSKKFFSFCENIKSNKTAC